MATTANDLIAIGTLVLAAVTAVLALGAIWSAKAASRAAEAAEDASKTAERTASATGRQAELAEEQLVLARHSFEASVQPLLVSVPRDHAAEPRDRVTYASGATQGLSPSDVSVIPRSGDTDPQFLCVSVAFRNVGPAGAAIVACGLFAGDRHPTWSGNFSKTIVPPGELVRVTVSMPLDRPELQPIVDSVASGTLTVRIAYRDMSGRQLLRTDAHLQLGATNSDRRVRQIAIFRDDEVDPFLIAGPADG